MIPIVYIINKDQVTNSLIKRLLNSVNIQAIEFLTPDELLKNLPVESPSCFLIDFFLETMNGIEVMKKIKQTGDYRPCIFMSSRDDTGLIIKAMNMGASGFIKRPFNHIEAIDLIQKTIEKNRQTQFYVKSAMTYQKRLSTLSRREMEIFIKLTDGYSAKKIGDILNISFRTVENHRIKIYEKLKISKATELIRQATIHSTLKACQLI